MKDTGIAMVAIAGLPNSKITNQKDINNGKLTDSEIDEFVSKMSHGKQNDKILLGRNGTSPYDELANYRNKDIEFEVFKDDDGWNELVERTNSNWDEIWSVDKAFLDKAISNGKDIYLANDPNVEYLLDNGAKSFTQREIDYLKELNYVFESLPNNLWRAYK